MREARLVLSGRRPVGMKTNSTYKELEPSAKRPLPGISTRLRLAIPELVVAETLFLLTALAIYWIPVRALAQGSPPEVSLGYIYPLTGPLSYLTFWAQFSSWVGWGAFDSYVIESVVTLVFLLNSSWLLLNSISDALRPYGVRASYRRFVRPEILAPALLLSLSPIFVTTFIGFGLEYFALMNISLWLIVLSSRTGQTVPVFTAQVAGATLALTLACNEYILIAPDFLVILFIFSWCHPGLAGRRKLRFFALGVVSLFAAVAGSLSLAQFGSTLGSSVGGQVQPTFHVVNLYYYDAVFRYGPVLPSLFGLNTSAIPFWTPLAALALTALFGGLLFALLVENAGSRNIKVPLLLALVILTAFNLNVSNGSSTLGLITTWLVGSHAVRYDHLGVLLSIADDNRIVLVPFWYVLAALISLALISHPVALRGSSRTHPWKSAGNEDYIGHGRQGRQAMPRVVLVGALAVVVLMSMGWAAQTVDGFGLNPLNAQGSAPFAYVSLAPNPSYSQEMLLPTVSNFTSPYLYPNAMSPEGNDFPFYENFLRSEGSPVLNGLFSTFPASTFVIPNTTSLPYMNVTQLDSQFGYSTNWNASNVIAGQPVFVVGPESTFDNFAATNTVETVNGSESGFNGPNQSSINYLPLPIQNLELWNESYAISVEYSVSVSAREGGYYPVGLAVNSSFPFGYDAKNPFLGIQIELGANNTTYAYIQYTVSNTWKVVDQVPVGGANASFRFTIVILNVNGSGNAYVGVGGQWFLVGGGFSPWAYRYITMNAYRANHSLISFAGTVSNIETVREGHWIPIYYDSFFGSSTGFLTALSDSQTVLMAPGYGISDLALSDAVWSGIGSVVRPAAYAIKLPSVGWFQAFNYNPPQGALYAEGVDGQALPVQSGYGAYSGYAESTVAGSGLVVPLPSTAEGDNLSLNLLLSPIGGQLSVSGPGFSETIPTVANSTYYKWFQVSVPEGVTSVTLRDLAGFQSVNLITVEAAQYIHSIEVQLTSAIANKSVVGPFGYVGPGQGASITGEYDSGESTGQVRVMTPNGRTIMLELPTDVDYGASVSIISGTARVSIVPAWGSFLGVVLSNISGSGVLLSIRAFSLPILSDVVVLGSGELLLGSLVGLAWIRIRKRRRPVIGYKWRHWWEVRRKHLRESLWPRSTLGPKGPTIF